MISRHNTGFKMHFVSFVYKMVLMVKLKLEVVCDMYAQHTWAADVLVTNWLLGKPAAFDITANSVYKKKTSGSPAINRKHTTTCTEFARAIDGRVYSVVG